MEINLKQDARYSLDLRDDFINNEDLTLYEFIGKDPVRAFYLGIGFGEWFKELERKQQYLYSKQFRHNQDDLEHYQQQLQFWTKKYPEKGEVDLILLAEFILNNMFWNPETEDIDKVKIALFLGVSIKQSFQDETEKENNDLH